MHDFWALHRWCFCCCPIPSNLKESTLMSVPWVRSLTRPALPNDRLCLLLRTCFTWLCVRVLHTINVTCLAVSDFLFSTSIVAPPPHHKSGWGGRPSFHVLSCDSSAVNAVYCKGWKIFRQSFCNFSCLLPAGWSIGVSNNKSGFRRENRHKGDNIRRYQIQCRTKQSISIYVGPPSRDGMSVDNASWACVGQWVPRSLLHVFNMG